AGIDLPVPGQQRRPDVEMGVRRIGELPCGKSAADQVADLCLLQFHFSRYASAPSATFIMAVKLVCRCSAVVISGETKLSEIVSRQAARLPRTLALWNRAKLSISTARQPFSSRRRSQYVGFASLGWR